MTESFVCKGQITQQDGGSPRGLLVRCFDKDLPSLGGRSEQQLGGDVTTDDDGRYTISFATDDFQRGEGYNQRKIRPDVFVRVYDEDALVGESGIRRNAGHETSIDLEVSAPQRSEYDQLLHALTPVLQGIAIADLTDDDLAFLKGEVGTGEGRLHFLGRVSRLLGHDEQAPASKPDHLALLRRASQFAHEADVRADACYAWVRLLDPASLDDLAARAAEELSRTLATAITNNLVPASLTADIDATVRRLQHFKDVSYQAICQLTVDDAARRPELARCRVQVADISHGGSVDLGTSVADGQGRFSFIYAGPPLPPTPATTAIALEFRFAVIGQNGQPVGQAQASIGLGSRALTDVPIALPPAAPSATLPQVAAAANIKLPAPLASFLGTKNIESLADIRRVGGLNGVQGLPVGPDHAAVAALQAHADLDRISHDPVLNSVVINAGYSSVASIAQVPAAVFVSALHDSVGDAHSTRLHAAARAQTAILDSLIAGAAAAHANGFAPPVTAADGTALLADKCVCEDCESALSPAIYLADLLDYATARQAIHDGANPIGISDLANLLRQPFGDLSVSCQGVTETVRRVRICVEVLWAQVVAGPALNPSQTLALQTAWRDYLVAAYTVALVQIGTSYEQVRLARSAPDEQRKALAERLGIALTRPRPADELDRLLLDLDIALGAPGTATALQDLERKIEELFGLQDTRRDPLADGAKFGDDGNAGLTRWQLAGIEWGRNTDIDGYIHLLQETPSAGAFDLKLFKGAARTPALQVASSSTQSALGAVVLSTDNVSGLSASLTVAAAAPTSAIYFSALPNMLAWRLRRLRSIWASTDHPDDAYSDDATTTLPLIDPDLVGPDDFRNPLPKANPALPTRPFDLWLARRGFVDKALATLQTDREASADGLNVILKEVFGLTMPDFDTLLHDLTQGDQDAATNAALAIGKLGMSVDGFTRFMALRDKDTAARTGPGEPVGDAEWGELYSILVQVLKVRRYPAWRAEEQQLGIVLGLREFWHALREPVPGSWPVAMAPGVPLIDPDLQTLRDLPEPVAGPQAIARWHERRVQVRETLPAQLDAARRNSGFGAMVELALGSPPGTPLPAQDDLDTLRTHLASGNVAVAAAARDAINHDLMLSVDDFNRMMTVRDKDAANDLKQKPTVAEYQQVVAILTNARKLKTEYALWAAQERADFGREGAIAGEPLAYWRARKAALPQWRADAQARKAWTDALQARSSAPVVDPDLIDPFDLRDPVAGNAAFDLWQRRTNDVATRLAAITTSPPIDKAGLDSLLRDPAYLGVDSDALLALDAERSQGHAIGGRLEQLGLTTAGFNALLASAELLIAGQPVLPAEWTGVASILVECYKLMQFAAWRIEEAATVSLNPDLFQVRASPTDPVAPVPAPPLPAWRTDGAARRAWDETLRGRMAQQDGVIAALRDAIDATEEATLVDLRDGLIPIVSAIATDLAAAADGLTQQFLIDFRAGPCQSVTRVEQALETMQSLFYAVRTGQGGEHLPPSLHLGVDSSEFDSKWKWLGSYATWRAALLVFVYPEVLLLPVTRPDAWRTPAFDVLAATVSATTRVAPELACRAAAAYSTYYQDICTLAVEATCQTLTIINQVDACHAAAMPDAHYLMYMFARGGLTNRIYWCAYNPDAKPQDHAQGKWTELAAASAPASSPASARRANGISRLIGAVPFVTLSGDGYICLFVQTVEFGRWSIALFRFRITTQEWEQSSIDLPPPLTDRLFKATIVQNNQAENDAPGLLIQYADGSIFTGRLNRQADAWETNFPAPFLDMVGGVPVPRFAKVLDSVWDGAKTSRWSQRLGLLIAVPPQGSPVGATGWQSNWFQWDYPPVVQSSGVYGRISNVKYHGTVWLPFASNLPAGYNNGGDWPTVSYVLWEVNGLCFTTTIWGSPTFLGVQQIEAIVPAAGYIYNPHPDDYNSAPRQFVYEVRYVSNIGGPFREASRRVALPQGGGVVPGPPPLASAKTFRRCTFGWSTTGGLFLTADEPLVPNVQGPFNIPCELPGDDAPARADDVKSAFDNNAGFPASLLEYLEEAYFFVPMHLALQLQRSGEYEAALGWFRTVYDYALKDPSARKIYYGLRLEESLPNNYAWSLDWLDDALNPHAVAQTRRNSYTRYTLLCIAQCLLDYGDHAFSEDTGESVVRARTLYEQALELLSEDALTQSPSGCSSIIDTAALAAGPDRASAAAMAQVKALLRGIRDRAQLVGSVAEVAAALVSDDPPLKRLDSARRIAAKAQGRQAAPAIAVFEATAAAMRQAAHRALLTSPDVESTLLGAGTVVDAKLAAATSGLQPPGGGYIPSTIGLWGCIPPHPLLTALQQHATLNLQKLRSCRNIGGMKRALDPYAAPIRADAGVPAAGLFGPVAIAPAASAIQPTLYRFDVLLGRARQLAQTASQLEAQMLSALEKYDDQSYRLLKARQDLGLAQATVKLHVLRVSEAGDRLTLSKLQKSRVDDQIAYFQELLSKPISDNEQAALDNYREASDISEFVSQHSEVQGFSFGLSIAGPSFGIGVASASGETAADASAASSDAARTQLLASFERRSRDWQFQLDQVNDDASIGAQQISIANDDVAIANQEKSIAELQQSDAADALAFLTNAFTNADLYGWMSGVLERVYGYFLRQATAMARLAENQLGFERQRVPPTFVQADYWSPAADLAMPAAGNTDRKGLTGAERLLGDITQLDQYAFLTDTRKLQLSQTVSLARLSPLEFQRFTEAGVMTFATPMELFDRNFPGHYLRLIRRVRTSVVALIPSGLGIAATLSNNGLSRTVVGADSYQSIVIRRDPEEVALTSPVGATGLIEMTPQSESMLLPFEGTGVESTWELRMEKASNLFDYRTIGDVLLTIEYTALSSSVYRAQVIQLLGNTVIAERPYSVRDQFPDAWYDLHNPDQTLTPLTVRFSSLLQDFPPNIADIRIQQVVLYFVRATGADFEIGVTLRFRPSATQGTFGGAASSLDGVISTRRGNAGSWSTSSEGLLLESGSSRCRIPTRCELISSRTIFATSCSFFLTRESVQTGRRSGGILRIADPRSNASILARPAAQLGRSAQVVQP